jgi:hypothetical protein
MREESQSIETARLSLALGRSFAIAFLSQLH